ncbi:MAG: hypothetical protein WCC80_16175, partial [Pseudolabrys sp.]
MSTLYLHSFVSAGGGVAVSRTIGFPNRPVNLSVDLNAQIKGTADVVAFGPTYVFATPVLGGQFAITALGIVGHQQANVDATVTGALGPIGFATESSISDSRTAFGDVFPAAYAALESGREQLHDLRDDEFASRCVRFISSRKPWPGSLVDRWWRRLHLFRSEAGWEFSAVAGLTYNFINPS